MPATYEPIATTTLGSAAMTITFSSITSAYTDLRLVLVPSGVNTTGVTISCRFNSDSGSNYSETRIQGNGSTVTSNRLTSSSSFDVLLSANDTIPAMAILDIFNYAGNTNKTALVNEVADFNGSGNVIRRVALWRSTSAINQISLFASSTNTMDSGTTATLYGILKA